MRAEEIHDLAWHSRSHPQNIATVQKLDVFAAKIGVQICVGERDQKSVHFGRFVDVVPRRDQIPKQEGIRSKA